jgi:tetratricopeptide (TPR) repeat protein
MSTPRIVKVFIASPNDLAIERRAFKEVVDELNKGFGRGAHVEFEPLGWEDALSLVGRRSQSVINQDVDACDVFVLVMWRRWGQEAPDAAPYSSYTEEEFYRALARFEKDGKPAIFVFFKHIDPAQMADPGPQLVKVLAFRKQLEQTRTVLYRGFDNDASFRAEIDNHLVAFVQGRCETIDADRAVPIIPDSIKAELDKHRADAQQAVEELEKLRAEAKRAQEDAEQARAHATNAEARAEAAERVAETKAAAQALTLAEDAAKAALDGKIEEARQGFAKALDGTTNLHILYLGFEFFERIGELEEAERLLRRWLAISGPDAETATTAEAYGNLGLVLRTHGDLDGAEVMHRKALAIEEKLRRLEGMAAEYGNLGIVLYARRDLDGAEAMCRKALEIDEKLGRIEGMANHYGNLGLVLEARGDLDEAEEMYRKSLAIDEKLGQIDGVAVDYGNLGNVLKTRGDLDGAEAMYRKSLAIDEKLGRVEGMANQHGNLGGIMKARGNLAGAREMWSKSRDLFAKLGARHMVERVQGWIDRLPK